MVVAVAAIETFDPSDLLPAKVGLRNAKAADQPWLTPLERSYAGLCGHPAFRAGQTASSGTALAACSKATATKSPSRHPGVDKRFPATSSQTS